MTGMLSSLKPYSHGGPIKVRAARIWVTTNNGEPTSFNCVFVDSQGGAIEGSARSRDVSFFLTKIKEGGFNELTNFYTSQNRNINAIVNHESLIDLKQNTRVQPLQTALPNTPRYFFSLTDFSVIPTRGHNSPLLIDVLGRVKAIQPLQTIIVRNSKLETKRDIIIENIRNEDLRITLWSDVAKRLNDSEIQLLQPPVVIVFAGFRASEFLGKPVLNSTAASIWYINPDIPEIIPYKHFFASTPNQIEQLPLPYGSTHTIQEQKRHNRKTIREILCMNPHNHKTDRFTCRASITDYDMERGWWYTCCSKCNKSLQKNGTQLSCLTHGVIDAPPIPWFRVDCIVTDGDDVTNFLMLGKTAENFFGNSARYYVNDLNFKDPFKITPHMADKLQKTRIFQLRFGPFRSTNNRCDIIVSNVFDDDSDNEPTDDEEHDVTTIHTIGSYIETNNATDQLYLPETPVIKEPQPTIISTPITTIASTIDSSNVPPTLQQKRRKLDFAAATNEQQTTTHHHLPPSMDQTHSHVPPKEAEPHPCTQTTTASPFNKGKTICKEPYEDQSP